MRAVINVQNLTYIYPQAPKPVLEHVSLKIEEGELVCLLGANGCGKSTLLKLLIKELLPTSGKITERAGASKAYMAQNMSHILFVDLTIRENLTLMRIHFSGDADAKNHLEQYHKKLPLYLDQPIKFLSGGEKQALALAVQLFHQPTILYLDEHTSALDPEAEKELMVLTTQKIKEQNITTLMCTHKIDLANKYSTRVIGLNQGKIAVDRMMSNQPLSKKDLEKIYL